MPQIPVSQKQPTDNIEPTPLPYAPPITVPNPTPVPQPYLGPTPRVDNDNSNSGGGIRDFFSRLFNRNSNDDPDKDQDDEPKKKTGRSTIYFGGKRVFHIGDGHLNQSSCRAEVEEYPLKGTAYHFNFYVLHDDTRVDIDLEGVCGVDYPDSNTITLYDGRRIVDRHLIPVNMGLLKLPSYVLQRGKHTLVVESHRGAQEDPLDNDDFIVSRIRVHSERGEIEEDDIRAYKKN